MVDPRTLDWKEGELPPVEEMPYHCRIVLFSDDYIGLVLPWGNNLNPLKWCDDSTFPRWGIKRPKGIWAILALNEEAGGRPEDVQTWDEFIAECKKKYGEDFNIYED